MIDDLDYSEKYNTKLTPEEEKRFLKWAIEKGKKTGRSPFSDMYDYDIKGAWKAGATDNPASNGHLPDTWKKPNHPTFSTESMYHGVEGNQGGKWKKNADGSWDFNPGSTNIALHSWDDLREYFQNREKGNRLVEPVVFKKKQVGDSPVSSILGG